MSAIAVGENGLVSPLTEADYQVVGVVEDVTFEDSTLEACVHELLGIPERTTLKTSDLWTITELTVPEGVATYADLRHFVQLKSLTIHAGTANDYSFLPLMPELETLDLSGSLVSAETLGYIGALPKLNNLNLSGCGLSNILPLADASTITVLDLSDNSITDISALASFTGLTHANLTRNAVTSLDALPAAILCFLQCRACEHFQPCRPARVELRGRGLHRRVGHRMSDRLSRPRAGQRLRQ